MGRFIQKRSQVAKPSLVYKPKQKDTTETKPVIEESNTLESLVQELEEISTSTPKQREKKITRTKKNKVMTTAQKISMAQDILDAPNVKKLKKEKGLLERTESSKTILTEDNKELLVD